MDNFIKDGCTLTLPVDSGVASGDPCIVGSILGVAIIDRDSDGEATICTEGVFDLSVKAVNDSGNSAVVIGDQLYYVDGDTPKLSKKDSGNFFGYALEAINAGSTATINVRKVCGPGPGTADILASAVGTSELAASAVTAAKAKVFFSTEKTGTGAPQNIAHGLGAVPTGVLVIPSVTAAGVSLVQGAHDGTNVVVTCTAADKFYVFAWA